MEKLFASNNKISDLFELTYLSNLKYLEIQNNYVEDLENLDFLNMIDKIEYINIANNPLIKELDRNILNDYFYVSEKVEIKNLRNNNDLIEINIDKRNFCGFDDIDIGELDKNSEISSRIKIKANGSIISLCKIIILYVNFFIR